MKKFLIFLFGVIVLVVGLDYLAGKAVDSYVLSHRLPGDSYSIDYTLKDLNTDVVIIGNSHVLNSLMPSVLSDTLGLSVYNSASNGQQIPFFHTIQQCILKRYSPKAIILGVNEDVFMLKGIGDRYNILAPYYGLGFPMIDSCLTSQSKIDKLMHKSSFYRFNTIWWRILLYHIVNKGHEPDGFIAMPQPPFPPKLNVVTQETLYVAETMAEFDRMLSECSAKNVKVIVIMPPIYVIDRTNHTITKKVEEIVRRYDNAMLINDASNKLFLSHPEYFFDDSHLNAEGALIYSKMKAPEIKEFLNKKK